MTAPVAASLMHERDQLLTRQQELCDEVERLRFHSEQYLAACAELVGYSEGTPAEVLRDLMAKVAALTLTPEHLRCLRWTREQIDVPPTCEPSWTRKGAIEAIDRLIAGAKP